MITHQVEDIRNIALVGHGAVGKTTLADLLLFRSGAATRAGSVADGTSLFDTDEDEKHHKHTISASLAHFTHHNRHINIIDTPGYPDFIGQVIGCLRAVETAVITISAAAGIEVNARRVFALSEKENLGRMVLVNKCDLDNVDLGKIVASLQETFGARCIPLNLPIGAGPSFSGVISTLNVPDQVPPGVLSDPKAANQAIMDAVAEADDDLMERYLEGQTLTSEEVESGMTKAIAHGTLIPILFASTRTGVGIPEFMDAVAHYALHPGDVPRTARSAKGDEVPVAATADGPLIAEVFKTRIDSFVGKMNFIRVYQGRIAKDGTVVDGANGKTVKLSQIAAVQGNKQEPVAGAVAGDIVAVVKVEDLKLGDSLAKDANGPFMPPFQFPTPMIGLAVEPKSHADQQKISTALHKIEDEDPTFKVTRDGQTKEMVMRGLSELHLQMVRERLHAREKVDIVTHPPKIPYRETVSGKGEGHYRHKKQSGGSGQFAEVHFRIGAVPRDIKPEEFFTKERFPSLREYKYDPNYNFAFVDSVSGGSVPNNFIPAVEKGVKERMEQGVIAGYHVQDVYCELFFGKDHPVDSNETAFKIAASMCFREVFKTAKPQLLEPIVTIEINVPSAKLGDITSDLNGRRGRVDGMGAAPGGFQSVHAKVPLAEVMTYARALSSMTGGQGSYTLEFSHYDLVPPNEQAKIVAAAAKHEEPEKE